MPELRDGYAIARTALALRGIPYRLGGTDPHGFDCSGLVQYVFALNGLGLPRVVRDQYRYGEPVKLDALEPGDLVFFETQGDEVSHVGIAIGGDQFVHAPNSRGQVRISRLTSGYWGDRAIGARRLVMAASHSSSLVHGFTGSRVHGFTGSQVHRFTGSQVHRFTGSLRPEKPCAGFRPTEWQGRRRHRVANRCPVTPSGEGASRSSWSVLTGSHDGASL